MQLLGGDGTNTKPSCRVYNDVAISVANTSNVALTFNQERWDAQAMHSTSSNTGRITIPTGWGGKYRITGHVEFAANATGTRWVGIRVDGSTFIAIQQSQNAGGSDPVRLTVSTDYVLAATQYLELVCYQSSGGSLNVNAASAYSPEFSAMWMAV